MTQTFTKPISSSSRTDEEKVTYADIRGLSVRESEGRMKALSDLASRAFRTSAPPDFSGGCTIEGELVPVVTLAPDQAAIQIVISAGQNVILESRRCGRSLLLLDPDKDERYVEFHLPRGVVI